MEDLEKDLTIFKNSSADHFEIMPHIDKKKRKEVYLLCEKMGFNIEKIGTSNNRRIIVHRNIQKDINNVNVDNVNSVNKDNIIDINDNDRKQFIKDFNLPIPVYKEPHFSYYLELFDDLYNSKSKYELLKDAIKKTHNLKKYTYELMNRIVEKIKSQSEYENFVKDDKYDSKELPNRIDIYNKFSTEPKFYISIDIIKANYNCMKFYNRNLVMNTDTWEEFMMKFTDIQYFIESKYFRQIIFGNLKSKKMVSIQKYIISLIYSKMKDKILGKISSDELIISTDINNAKNDFNEVVKILDEFPDNIKSILKITLFSLESIGNSKAFIRKNYKPDKIDDLMNKESFQIEIKNIEKDFHAQAYKFINNLEIINSDRIAMKDNYVITYNEDYLFV